MTVTKKRTKLTDRQCRVFLKSMREFGYPDLTFESVRKTADCVHEGTYNEKDVIAVIMAEQIDSAMERRRA